MTVEEPQSRRTVMGLEHAIAELAEAVDRVGPDVVVVLDHDNGLFLRGFRIERLFGSRSMPPLPGEEGKL